MSYIIPLRQTSINFAPRTLLEEVVQNVITICSTVKGSVPLDREFGVDGKLVDEPENIARAKVSAEMIRAIRRFEPRAEVLSVKFKEGETVIEIELKEG